MALPSVQVRLRELHQSIDRLLAMQPTGQTKAFEYGFNELRLVRATLAWESFLEDAFICYLRGSRPASGTAIALSQSAVRNRADALALILHGHGPFGKWLNEGWSLGRAGALFSGTHPFAILSSPTFPIIRHIRNRIVHRSDNVRAQFWSIAVGIYGSARPGMTPGRLLSEQNAGTQRIDTYLIFLKNAGSIIAT